MSYHILKNKVAYKELGVNYLDDRRKDKITKSYIKRLTNLGYEVVLKKAAWSPIKAVLQGIKEGR